MSSYLPGFLRFKAPAAAPEPALEEPEFSLETLTEKAVAEVADNRVPHEFLSVLKVTPVKQDWDPFRQMNPGLSLSKAQQFFLQRTLSGLKKMAKLHDDELEKDPTFKGQQFRIPGQQLVITLQAGNTMKVVL